MANQFYYETGGQQFGPIGPVALKALAASGQLHTDDDVWEDGAAKYTLLTAPPRPIASTETRR